MNKRLNMSLVFLLLVAVLLVQSNGTLASGGKITVLIEGANVIADAFRHTAPDFTEKTGYEVELVTSPYIGIFDKMTAELRAPIGAYDVALIDILWIPFLAHGLTPLEELMTSDVRDDLYPGLLSGGSFDDTIYGMPAWTNNKALLYREDLFSDADNQAAFKEEYGYELAPPSNWDQFRDAANFFTRDTTGDGLTDLFGTVLFGADADGVTQWLDFALQAGAEDVVVDQQGRNMLAHDPAPYIEALDYMQTILRDQSVPAGVLEFTVPQAMNMFQDGSVAMMLVWGHFYIQANDPDTSSVGGNVAVAPMISGAGGMGAIPGPWYFVVPTSAKQPDIAKEYIRFLYENNSVFMQAFSLGLGARKSVFNEYMEVDGYDHLAPLAETLSGAQTTNRPAVREWEEISQEALLPALQYALLGEKTAEEAVAWAASIIDEIVW